MMLEFMLYVAMKRAKKNLKNRWPSWWERSPHSHHKLVFQLLLFPPMHKVFGNIKEKAQQPPSLPSKPLLKISSNIKKIALLKLKEEKVNLMKDSIFGNLSSITNERESSTKLVLAFCNTYDPESKSFQLNNNTIFRFCAHEIGRVVGMSDMGSLLTHFDEYDKMEGKQKSLPEKVEGQINQWRAKKGLAMVGPSKTGKLTASELKNILMEMPVEDDAQKDVFKKLMTFFLLEKVLLPSSNPKKVRTSNWWWVQDLSECEKVKWQEKIETQLLESLSSLKKSMQARSTGRLDFTGCAPVLETIIYDRIPKLRPPLSQQSDHGPSIQKYSSCRWKDDKSLPDCISKLSLSDIERCVHCFSSSSTQSDSNTVDENIEESHEIPFNNEETMVMSGASDTSIMEEAKVVEGKKETKKVKRKMRTNEGAIPRRPNTRSMTQEGLKK